MEEDFVYVRPSFKAFLLTMWNLFWTAFVYPNKTTVIDALTGKIIEHRE